MFSLLGGVALLVKRIDNRKVQIVALPFAAGALLAAAFGDLIPEAIEHSSADEASLVVLLGFLFFFVLERFLGWFHHHHEHKSDIHKPKKILIIAGDAIHNLIDGIAMGAAFLADPVAGIVTTVAVAAHEIPKEMGDFGLLLGLGMRRRNVLLANLFSAGVTVLGAAVVYGVGASIVSLEPMLLAATAGFFIYIAASDLVPTIHAETRLRTANLQTAVLLAGTIIVIVTITSAHKLLH